MTAGAERLLLSQDPAFAAVDFWDQPLSTGPGAFARTVAAAAERARELARRHGAPIDLIAHSFGGHIAREIIRIEPESVSSLRLISAGHDVAEQFLRLVKELARDPETPAELAAKMREFLARDPASANANIWETIGLVVRDPEFMRLYWKDRKQFDAFKRLTAGLPPADAETFQSVIKDYLKIQPTMPTRMEWKGKAELILGENDPLMDHEKCSVFWRGFFPQLEIEIRKSSGHYPHLETPLAEFIP